MSLNPNTINKFVVLDVGNFLEHMEFNIIYCIILLNFQGPIAVFNAKNQWSAPRTVILNRASDQGFGFSVRGDCPVKVADIEPGSVAEVSVSRGIDAVHNSPRSATFFRGD